MMTEQAYKTCPKCGCSSVDVDFSRSSNANYCLPCSNRYFLVLKRLKKTHPYPVNHQCDICGKSEEDLPASFGGMGTGNKGKLQRQTPWRLDHCHATGEFRGFLCNSCNLGLGKFKDDPEILMNAISYLEAHKQKAAL